MRNDEIYLEAAQKDENGEPKTVSLSTNALLITAGRLPNIEGLNLEAAGVSYTKQGIPVNAYLQTSAPHIYAAGDIGGQYWDYHTCLIFGIIVCNPVARLWVCSLR